MLLLGAELLKEVEEAAAASASAAAATAAATTTQMDESRASSTWPLLLPIGHYVTQGGPENRSILLDQVMSSVPAAQWQAILPPVLKVKTNKTNTIFHIFRRRQNRPRFLKEKWEKEKDFIYLFLCFGLKDVGSGRTGWSGRVSLLRSLTETFLSPYIFPVA